MSFDLQATANIRPVLRAYGRLMEQNRRILFPAADLVEPVFGPGCRLYGPLVNAIAPRVLGVKYSFEDNDSYQTMLANAPHQALQIYWREVLYRAHMAATMSMVRTSRLVDAAVRQYHADNLLGWAACCGALIAASGDSLDALMSVSVTLAEGHKGITAHLAAAKVDTMQISKELEDTLIHFTHARRVRRNDNAPASHKAKPSHEYI